MCVLGGGGVQKKQSIRERERENLSERQQERERERELLACRGRSRISYAQEVGAIKIDMGCIRPGHAQLTSHKS